MQTPTTEPTEQRERDAAVLRAILVHHSEAELTEIANALGLQSACPCGCNKHEIAEAIINSGKTHKLRIHLR